MRINVPLYFVRLKIKTLDPALHYVVVCDNGRRSSAAAYILSERGFDAVRAARRHRRHRTGRHADP